MEQRISLFIADDHPIFRCGLRETIEKRSERFVILGEADDGEKALSGIVEIQPELAVVDIEMPKLNGLELAERLSSECPKVKTVILTSYKEESFFNRAMDLGVKGYVLKENAIHDLTNALESVASGEIFLSPSISAFLLNRVKRLERLESQEGCFELLTPMELRVLRLISENKTNKEIGELLFISPRTVNTHRTNMSSKLKLRGSRALLLYALEHKSELARVRWMPGDE